MNLLTKFFSINLKFTETIILDQNFWILTFSMNDIDTKDFASLNRLLILCMKKSEISKNLTI